MKKENSLKSSFLLKMAFIAAMLLFPATLINAQAGCTPQLIGTYNQTQGGNPFVFTSSGSSATYTGTAQASFRYFNIQNLPAELQGAQTATVTIQTSTNSAALISNGRTVQPLSNIFIVTITRTTPASVGSGSRTLLLRATVSAGINPVDITGEQGNSVTSASLSASSNTQNITFQSDFVAFDPSATKGLAIAIDPIIQRFFAPAPGQSTVESFNSATSGNFSTCQTLRFNPPVAADAEIGGRVLTPSGAGLAKARVTLTVASGETFTTMTNSFGYYKFTGIEAGQSVVISVTSKRYRYSPKVLNVGEDLSNSDFIPE